MLIHKRNMSNRDGDHMIDYVVRPGDTFYSIAATFGITPTYLLSVNPKVDPDNIFVGQIIRIPDIYMRRIIEVNGYAFPDIDGQILIETLPYLTYLSIFSYQVLPDGSLIGIDDEELIQTARQVMVAPMMVITNIKADEGFSSTLAHTILTDVQAQQTLLNNVISVLTYKNYYGLNIDFEYVNPKDRLAYARFLKTVTERLRPYGFITSVTVAPKTGAGQLGPQYEGYEYSLIGDYVYNVIIATYEWGYTFGPPFAVSSIEQVQQAIEYAVSVIPSQKILMGMPNYGYDWVLPYQAYSSAQIVSFNEAEALAKATGSDILFDPEKKASYFNYVDDMGLKHVVWFDNEVGIRARLAFVEAYNLGGVSFWTINNFSPASYQTLNSMYDVRKVLFI